MDKCTKASRASFIMLIVDLVLLALVTGAIMVVKPQFAQMFAEFDVVLPVPTTLVLSTSSWVYALIFLILAAGLVTKEHLLARSSKLRLNIAALIFTMVYVGTVVVALFLPLMGPWMAVE